MLVAVEHLRLLHFGLLCAWSGVLLVEFVIESLGDDDDALASAARAHFWIDVLIEIPLVLAVLTTGAMLLAQDWPPSHVLVVKVVSALVAIGLNLYCCGVVIVRYRRRGDPAAVRGLRRRVRLSALGIPFGALAAYLGFAYFLR